MEVRDVEISVIISMHLEIFIYIRLLPAACYSIYGYIVYIFSLHNQLMFLFIAAPGIRYAR